MTDKTPADQMNDEIREPGIEGDVEIDDADGVEEIFDVGDHTLSEEERVALGIDQLEALDPDEPGEPGPPE